MKDFLGQDINIGDLGVCIVSDRTSSWFQVVEVVGMTPQYLKIEYRPKKDWQSNERKSPHLFVKCRAEDITLAMLRGGK